MPITEEQIEALKAEHPGDELHLLANEEHGAEVVVKVPNDGEWKRYRTTGTDPAQRPFALRSLLLACIVYPAPAEVSAMLARRPGLVETFGAELLEIAGVSQATTRRKL
jgi:hypothetical protein